ncbi:MAG: DEAD/DEAH box helicase [bacterium]
MLQITEYKGLTLSAFQTEAIDGILAGENVIVATHTGNGKTLVADYAVGECFRNNQQVIYTAPIKALSNQKFGQFVREYGTENVGLITGDRVVNQTAGILVVTTEILRNLMHESPERVENIRYIILDEIHYMNDEERGTVWEEIIIFKRPTMRLIGLSATIPNIAEISGWIKTIHREPVRQIYYPERIVPQEHAYFDRKLGRCGVTDIVRNYKAYAGREGGVPYRNTHLDFIDYASRENILPVLYFVFSRQRCEEKALELAQARSLASRREQAELADAIAEHETKYPDIVRAASWRKVKSVVTRGVGFHHAGLLPIIKQFMETVFEQKLCKVLYTTETFAVGINYPVKTVCFDNLRKFDGKTFRNLNGSEYLQMAGRAGRRGIDAVGLVFVLADYMAVNNGDLTDLAKMESDAIRSQFALNYNTVLNLARRFPAGEVKKFFRRGFATYQYRRILNQYRRQLRSARMRLEREKAELLPDRKCGRADLSACPAMLQRYREELRDLQIRYRRKATMEAEKVTLREMMRQLRQKLNVRPAKCPKPQRRECFKALRRLQKTEKEVRRRENTLREESDRSPDAVFYQSFGKKLRLLQEMKYIAPSRLLLPRGEICARLHIQELLVTELLFDGFFHALDADQLNGVAAGIVFENEMYENFAYDFPGDLSPVIRTLRRIQAKEQQHRLAATTSFLPAACGVVHAWSAGEDFFGLTVKAGVPEGDFVALCRRVIDLLRQLRTVTAEDRALQEKLRLCMDKMDRGIISLGL